MLSGPLDFPAGDAQAMITAFRRIRDRKQERAVSYALPSLASCSAR
jgi:hypothetical protein